MLKFDPADPFPLLPQALHDYAEAQRHSSEVDAWLGLAPEKIENWLCENTPRSPDRRQELWVGLPVKALLTPYTEIRAMLEQIHLRPGQSVVDLGAGYGRMAFVIARHFPGVKFVGYEFVDERVREGQRCLAGDTYKNVKLEQADLSAPGFQPLKADCYFIYDYGTREAISKTLADLQEIARERALTVIGRGRASRDAIERDQPWLSQVIPPQHFAHYSIYRSGLAV